MARAPAGMKEFLLYRDTVPEDVRDHLKETLLSAKMEGYDEFIACSQYIMAELAAGNISPTIAQEMRSYLELVLTAISAKRIAAAAEGPKRLPKHSSISAQLEAAKTQARKIRPALEMSLDADGNPQYVEGVREMIDAE